MKREKKGIKIEKKHHTTKREACMCTSKQARKNPNNASRKEIGICDEYE
jgi:hypothetical protein